jgi:hypothetical protein
MGGSTWLGSSSSQFVVVALSKDHEMFSAKLKAENRDSTLDHCMEAKLPEVVVLERDGALVVGALELDQFPIGTAVVATIPSGA